MAQADVDKLKRAVMHDAATRLTTVALVALSATSLGAAVWALDPSLILRQLREWVPRRQNPPVSPD